jgi:diaminopimelate epimerase
VDLVKAHAYGNDFLLVAHDAMASVTDRAAFARRVCERHRGVGADGLLVVTPTASGAAIDLLNADGSHSEISGNGIRCVAAWLAETRPLQVGETTIVDTEAGPKPLSLLETRGRDYCFRAGMGEPDALRQEDLNVDG